LFPPEKELFSLGTGEQRRNHPGNLVVAYRELARLRGVSEHDLREQVKQNFIRLFGSLMTIR
jgi:Tat protein secretion system quality control protein TatD with DNase activity